MAGYFSPQC